MPESIFFVTWDDYFGSKVEYQYPPVSKLTEKELAQYLLALQLISTSPVVHIRDESQSVLIYGIPTDRKSSDAVYNYNLLVTILREDEMSRVEWFQNILNIRGEKILKADESTREDLFNKLVQILFQPNEYKISFIGFPNAGKTTTKQFLFEYIDSEILLEGTFEPTRGVQISSHLLVEEEISLFDASGQELDRWLENPDEVMVGSDLIVVFFSTDDWKNRKEMVLKTVDRFIPIRKQHNLDIGEIILFCHKIDLAGFDVEVFKEEVRKSLAPYGFPVFFTSIVNGGNRELYMGLEKFLSNISEMCSIAQEILRPLTQLQNIRPIAVLDKYYREIITFMKNEYLPTSLSSLKNNDGHYKFPVEFLEPILSYYIFPVPKDRALMIIDCSFIHRSFTFAVFQIECFEMIPEFMRILSEIREATSWVIKGEL